MGKPLAENSRRHTDITLSIWHPPTGVKEIYPTAGVFPLISGLRFPVQLAIVHIIRKACHSRRRDNTHNDSKLLIFSGKTHRLWYLYKIFHPDDIQFYYLSVYGLLGGEII